MRYRCLQLFLAVAAVAPIGCAVQPLGGARTTGAALPSGGAGTTPSTPSATGVQAGVARKRVNGKEEPATLIALDRTRCTVTEARFRDIKIGDDVTCAWSASDRAP
jgi:hypothetical protein